MRACLLLALALSACSSGPRLVMLNPRTGSTVGCQVPDATSGAADFLVSRACLSACEAHGFRPMPGVQGSAAGSGIPSECSQ